jgi:hypothetical protein
LRGPAKPERSLDGGCIVCDGLGRAESCRARLLAELRSDEGQRLLSEIIGQLGGLAGGLGQAPAMREQVVEADLQPLSAGGYPERAVVGPFEDSESR